jgi:hypothetical protein
MLWFLVLSLLLAIACDLGIHAIQPVDRVEHSIQRAVAYLDAEYERGAFGLLPESPEARPNKHWLATDNQVAVWALRAADEEVFATQLERALRRWGTRRHGIIEALAGEPISWPPHPEQQFVIGPYLRHRTATQPNACSEPKDSPEKVICQETRNTQMPRFDDWQEYADLALYGALNACNRGNTDQAHDYYGQALELFNNGVGFADKAYCGGEEKYYATYKLALALYVGAALGEPVEEKLLAALLDKQDGAGGFYALYDSEGVGQGDSNTETTAYAILALATLHNERSGHGGAVVCPRD